jgi:hypothetical protein
MLGFATLPCQKSDATVRTSVLPHRLNCDRFDATISYHEVGYQEFDLGNWIVAILCTSGRTCHIVKHDDGTWTVLEDEQLRTFPNRGAALDCAREIAGDPDLPPLHQI